MCADVTSAVGLMCFRFQTKLHLPGLAYPVNGIVMGGLDWVFSMFAMWAANFACIGLIRGFAMKGAVSLNQIWWGLAVSSILIGCIPPYNLHGCLTSTPVSPS